MTLESIGLSVSILGVLLIIFGGLFYLFENKNRVMVARAARTLGIGILTIKVGILFSIANHLGKSTTDEINLIGIIILTIFLGSPLLFMGLGSYIGLNAKAHQILNPTTAREKLRYYSPIQKKKIKEDALME